MEDTTEHLACSEIGTEIMSMLSTIKAEELARVMENIVANGK